MAVEQIGRTTPKSNKSKLRSWVKRQAARLRRRLEKHDVENAPSRTTKFWAD